MNTKLKCLLLDDELLGLSFLKLICEQIPDIEVVKAFNNPSVFIAEFENYDFDFCILDIEMPEINGLEVAKHLPEKPIIFTTAYSEFAADAYDLNAIDYVRKPVKIERLQQAISKIQQLQLTKKTKRQSFQINTNKGKSIVFFDQLFSISTSEIDSRDKDARLTDGSSLVLKNISFEKLKQLLPPTEFVQINKKEMIATNSILSFTYDQILVKVPFD
ncbi:MAG: DNA-binding response regulator, partial [Crocinitomicaceae bacterium]|nr:DNA-binding response regulator [Crocinitomicaceae bacterium]